MKFEIVIHLHPLHVVLIAIIRTRAFDMTVVFTQCDSM